jgi:hypothetical protein
VTRYVEGDQEEPFRLRGEVTDGEIVRQNLEQLTDMIEAMRRDHKHPRHEPTPPKESPPPQNGWLTKYGPTIFTGLVAIFGIFLTAKINDGREEQREANQRMSTIDLRSRDTEAAVKQINEWRTDFGADVNGRLKALDDRTAPISELGREIGRLEKATENLESKVETGREERLADNKAILGAVGDSGTELKLLKQEVQQLRALIEGQRGPTLRRPIMRDRTGSSILRMATLGVDDVMFAQFRSEPPPSGGAIAATIDADRGEIAQLRRAVRRMREDLARPRGPRRDDGEAAAPADPAPPGVSRQRGPPKRQRRAAPPRSGVTIALERAFGRPFYRGRYWGSMRRYGMFR